MGKGAVHDFDLFKCNLHFVPTNYFILADEGYQEIYVLYSNMLISKTKKCGELYLLLKNISDKLGSVDICYVKE